MKSINHEQILKTSLSRRIEKVAYIKYITLKWKINQISQLETVLDRIEFASRRRERQEGIDQTLEISKNNTIIRYAITLDGESNATD